MAALMSTVILCGFTFKSPSRTPTQHVLDRKRSQTCCCGLLNKAIWRNRKYVLWVTAVPFALFGYFVPYVHIVKHVKDTLPGANGEQLLACMGVSSGIGRIIFGKLADIPEINPIVLQQVSFLCIGTLTMFIVVADTFLSLVFICLLMGLFDGCFISLIAPVALDLVGPGGCTQAIGFLLGICAVPLTVGPPVAGMLYDRFGNYNVAFLAAGVPPILACAFMFFIHRYRGESNTS